MARLSKLNKTKRQYEANAKLAQKRAEWKQKRNDPNTDPDERIKLDKKLKNTADGSKTRLLRRCSKSGRARGVYRRFNLARAALRDLANQGLLSGVKRASW